MYMNGARERYVVFQLGEYDVYVCSYGLDFTCVWSVWDGTEVGVDITMNCAASPREGFSNASPFPFYVLQVLKSFEFRRTAR